jgi:hypothetical protein
VSAGVFRKLVVVGAAAIVLVGIVFFVSQPAATSTLGQEPAQPTDSAGRGIRGHAEFKLQRDGTLGVTETIDVPEGGAATRHTPLRIPTSDDADRLYTVHEPAVQGNGKAEVTDGEFTVSLAAGRSTVSYAVGGVVGDLGDRQELHWQPVSGWDVPVDTFSATLVEPTPPRSISCLAGAIDSKAFCAVAKIDQSQVVRISQNGLHAGERVDLAVALDPGSVPASARTARARTVATAFAPTIPALVGLAAFTALLLGGVWLFWHVRGRPTRVVPAPGAGPRLLVRAADGHVAFASPDGVLPGQLGAVATERVRTVDVTATVLDLAVRNYLWIEEVELPDGTIDWRVLRRNPVDGSLTRFECEVYRALLPEGTDQVLLSEFGDRAAGLMATVRDALFTDVLERRWFARRPEREHRRWLWAGVGLAALGAAATAALAFTVGYALIGLPVVVGGLTLATVGRWLPVRTRRGGILLGDVHGLQHYLHEAMPADLPEDDREMVFSRSLPYAVALGVTERWLRAFAGLDPDADGVPGLYWFGSAQPTRDLNRFVERFPALLSALDAALARAR